MSDKVSKIGPPNASGVFGVADDDVTAVEPSKSESTRSVPSHGTGDARTTVITIAIAAKTAVAKVLSLLN